MQGPTNPYFVETDAFSPSTEDSSCSKNPNVGHPTTSCSTLQWNLMVNKGGEEEIVGRWVSAGKNRDGEKFSRKLPAGLALPRS